MDAIIEEHKEWIWSRKTSATNPSQAFCIFFAAQNQKKANIASSISAPKIKSTSCHSLQLKKIEEHSDGGNVVKLHCHECHSAV
jgi:hypothetical protein